MDAACRNRIAALAAVLVLIGLVDLDLLRPTPQSRLSVAPAPPLRSGNFALNGNDGSLDWDLACASANATTAPRSKRRCRAFSADPHASWPATESTSAALAPPAGPRSGRGKKPRPLLTSAMLDRARPGAGGDPRRWRKLMRAAAACERRVRVVVLGGS